MNKIISSTIVCVYNHQAMCSYYAKYQVFFFVLKSNGNENDSINRYLNFFSPNACLIFIWYMTLWVTLSGTCALKFLFST